MFLLSKALLMSQFSRVPVWCMISALIIAWTDKWKNHIMQSNNIVICTRPEGYHCEASAIVVFVWEKCVLIHTWWLLIHINVILLQFFFLGRIKFGGQRKQSCQWLNVFSYLAWMTVVRTGISCDASYWLLT